MTRTGEYLGKLFAHMGKECYIEPPFYCDYGTNIYVGDYFYANTGLIVPDSVIAAGNPCKVIRMITNKDKEYWLKQLEEFEADTGEQVKLEQD